jgi:hypothetical protein
MSENLQKVIRRNKYVSTKINSQKIYIVGIAGITNNYRTSE